ncbi:MAG TPA: T9SS type A sorting domain-containing protein [Flavobacteriales bacterium]|nr:T9SS type A sorting domain-containing protein [Flavobacteriales bacterium]
MKTKIFFLIVFLNSFFLREAFAQVKPTHPRIFLDAGILSNLQTRAINNTVEWQELQTRLSAVSTYNAQQVMNIMYEGQHYAFMYALSYYATGNTADRDSSIAIFEEYFYQYTTDSSMYWDSGFESRSTMADVATLYDWLYADMSATFRNNVRTRLIHWGNFILTAPTTYGMWGTPYFFEGNNYSMGHLSGLAALGYAIHSEDPVNGNYFINVVDSVLPAIMNFVNTRLNGGDANEGWGYGAGYAASFFKTLAIIKTATIAATNHFAATNYDETVMHFLPTATLPDLRHMLAEGDWARESSGEIWDFHRLVADIISTYSDDVQTQQVALFWANETMPFSYFAVTAYRWMPFLFSHVEVAPIDYRTLPYYANAQLYTDTSGTDQFIKRTGWNANDQWVSYRGGGRYGDHAHNGSGHFSVYENGWLLIDKNIQSSSGIEGSDSMHNCIHFSFMNNDELYPFANDYNLAEHTFGKRRDLNTEYSYLWTDATPIYAARSSYFNVVDKSERQFLYIPGIKKIALFDLTQTNSSGYDNWFGINYAGASSLSGDSSYSYYSNGTSTAYVHTCYPLTKSVTNYGQSLRIGNSVSQQKDFFMHLITVLPVASLPVYVVPVNSENGRLLYSEFYGSFHEDVSKNYCILFQSDNAIIQHDSLAYEVPAVNGQLLHSYIAGVNVSTTYYVSWSFPLPGTIRVKVSLLNEPGSVAYTSSAGGILSFEITDPNMVSNLESLNQFNVFYNGSLGNLVIENNSNAQNQFTCNVYPVTGQNTGRVLKSTEGETLFIPVNHLSKGLYIVEVVCDKRIFRKKIMIH